MLRPLRALPFCIATLLTLTALVAGQSMPSGATPTPSPASPSPSGSGGNGTPIESQIMAYGGLKNIAHTIAADVRPRIGGTHAVLLQDATSVSQINLYKAFDIQAQRLAAAYRDLLAAQKEEEKRNDEILQLRNQLKQKDDDLKKCNQALQDCLKKKGGPGALNYLAPAPAEQPAPAATSAPTVSYAIPSPTDFLTAGATALNAIKSQITYTPQTFQPLDAAFATALRKELAASGVDLVYGGSIANISDAATFVDNRLADIQAIRNQIKVSPKDASSGKADPRLVTVDGALAGLQTWLLSSDGNGSIILTDVVIGRALLNALGSESYPVLAFSIDGAGGGTRSNAFFLLNVFYTPKPSFNAGVVVSYQLRGADNHFLTGDTLKVLYDYTKYKPGCYEMTSTTVDSTDLKGGPSHSHSIWCQN